MGLGKAVWVALRVLGVVVAAAGIGLGAWGMYTTEPWKSIYVESRALMRMNSPTYYPRYRDPRYCGPRCSFLRGW